LVLGVDTIKLINMKDFLLKIAIALKITQEKTNPKNSPIIFGKGYSRAYRLNPYNPLSYVLYIIIIPISFIIYGLIGTYNLIATNPFKWQ